MGWTLDSHMHGDLPTDAQHDSRESCKYASSTQSQIVLPNARAARHRGPVKLGDAGMVRLI